MKKLLKNIIYNKVMAIVFIKLLLKLHNKLYFIISNYSVLLNNGIHPKHKILKYKEWFLDNINENDVILDIGSNTGMMVDVLSTKAKFVYGIEINKEMVKIAKDQYKKSNIELICADATRFDYSKLKSIDCITLSNVLEHIKYREEFLADIIKSVKWTNNPKILIRVPSIERDWITIYKKELGIDYRLDDTHYIEFTKKQFQGEMRHFNLSIDLIECRFGEIFSICSG
ncbi:MAG TPA: class I SAM-dependent methyltransferase [Victivallales bacterium]|nr:class I SAM-dependent methyltransferase [Victivallales bacterium]